MRLWHQRLTRQGFRRELAFLAHTAAKLPLKKVSEPLTLVFHINELIGTCGERILSQLSHPQTAQVLALDLHMTHAATTYAAAICLCSGESIILVHQQSQTDRAEQCMVLLPPEHFHRKQLGRGIEPATLTMHLAQLSEAQQQRWLDACTVASMLLLVKQYLLSAYSLSAERVRQFHPSDSEKRKSEEKQPVVVNQKAQLHLQTLPLDCALSRDGLQAQGKVGAATGDKAPFWFSQGA